MATDLTSFTLSLLAEYSALPEPRALTWDEYCAQGVAEWLAENEDTTPAPIDPNPNGSPMADQQIVRSETIFSNEEFGIGVTVTIYPNAGVDEKGRHYDVVERSPEQAIVYKKPSVFIGNVGVLLGRAAVSVSRTNYYAAVVVKGGAIPGWGRNLDEVLSTVGSRLSDNPDLVFVLPAILEAWSRKGYPAR